MTRDNFSSLFAAVPPAAAPNECDGANAAENFSQIDYNKNRGRASSQMQWSEEITMATHSSSTSGVVNELMAAEVDAETNRIVESDGEGDLLVEFVDRSTSSSVTSHNLARAHDRPPTQHTSPGTESIQYLKRFGSSIGSMALKPLRELQLAEKLNAMNIEIEEIQNEKEVERMRLHMEARDRERRRPGISERENELVDSSEPLSSNLQEQEECQRIKLEAVMACQRIGSRHDALVKFTTGCPHGTYEELVEFLLMGGGRSKNDDESLGEYCNSLQCDNFYDENSEYRKMWNANLTLGFPETASTLRGRAFVPALGSTGNASYRCENSLDPWHSHSARGISSNTRQQQRTFSEEERIGNFDETLLDGTLLERERIKNQLAQVDKKMIRQGLGSAVSVISNVSSFALKPLRDLQMAEKLNAIKINLEEEETRKEIEQYNRMQEEKRHMEEMVRLKNEAKESCLKATREHLLGFIRENPDAKYHEWIEDLHPENAHGGVLLKGLGKTIDHRFFVEESDHRCLWNENLFTFLDPNTSEGRSSVPARTRQVDVRGEMVPPVDILSGPTLGNYEFAPRTLSEKSYETQKCSDFITFD